MRSRPFYPLLLSLAASSAYADDQSGLVFPILAFGFFIPWALLFFCINLGWTIYRGISWRGAAILMFLSAFVPLFLIVAFRHEPLNDFISRISFWADILAIALAWLPLLISAWCTSRRNRLDKIGPTLTELLEKSAKSATDTSSAWTNARPILSWVLMGLGALVFFRLVSLIQFLRAEGVLRWILYNEMLAFALPLMVSGAALLLRHRKIQRNAS